MFYKYSIILLLLIGSILMKKEVVEIRIDTKGNFTFLAKEGFSGTSCIERTKELELVLSNNAVVVSKKKTNDYYKKDDNDPLKLNINK